MMPYLTIALAKSAGGIDNRAPRPSLESLSDQATLRSIVWSLGLITVLWLFVLGV